jgi:hypothetical protein
MALSLSLVTSSAGMRRAYRDAAGGGYSAVVVSQPLLVPSNKAVGQVVEWLVWAAAVGHAEHVTHVFLPLDDRGVDGIVRRVADEAMCAVQVKGRTVIEHGHITAVVNRNALDDRHVTFVIAYLDPATVRLGDSLYGMDAGTVLELGSHSPGGANPEVALVLPYPPAPDTRSWPYACSLADLPTRLFPSAGVPEVAPTVPLAPPPARSPHRAEGEILGHLAELEVMRLLGVPPTVNTFKSFPDLEEAEYLVRHRDSGAIRGVQVKCLIVPDAGTEGLVEFSGISFVPSPLTDFVILAWRRDLAAFDDNAWLIPAADIPHLVHTDKAICFIGLRINMTARGSRFNKYRLSREAIAAAIEGHMAR